MATGCLQAAAACLDSCVSLTRLLLGGADNCSGVPDADALIFPLAMLSGLTNLQILGLSCADLEGDTRPGDDESWPLTDALGPTAGRLKELRLDRCYWGSDDECMPYLTLFSCVERLSIQSGMDIGMSYQVRYAREPQISWPHQVLVQTPFWHRFGLFELGSLRELDLKYASMKSFDFEGINLLSNLEAKLPWDAFYTLSRLRKLVATGTADRPVLAPGISALSSLEVLHLSFFRVGVPVLEEVCNNLVQLRSLDLSSCTINGLPHSVSRLRHLRQLQLDQNMLKQLPTTVGELRRLVSLGLGGNPLRSLPEQLTRLSRLQRLTLTATRWMGWAAGSGGELLGAGGGRGGVPVAEGGWEVASEGSDVYMAETEGGEDDEGGLVWGETDPDSEGYSYGSEDVAELEQWVQQEDTEPEEGWEEEMEAEMEELRMEEGVEESEVEEEVGAEEQEGVVL
ncbi:Protein lap4 [Tetrabaena socialis]|uniref:Protein lap4 n=1 Tax=Tetrabaena socialis TaxID=47790 RepID=A0A2J8A6Y6_9CHLO|nr:Protein lap4 [Tetrabaena socialis]|eukprot:PNH08291.1 Protein lap4 [Tetrabaena socialis]